MKVFLKRSVFGTLFVLGVCVFPSLAFGSVVQINHWNALEEIVQFKKVSCKKLDRLNNQLDPYTILNMAQKCVEKRKFADAVFLIEMSKMYFLYDIEKTRQTNSGFATELEDQYRVFINDFFNRFESLVVLEYSHSYYSQPEMLWEMFCDHANSIGAPTYFGSVSVKETIMWQETLNKYSDCSIK